MIREISIKIKKSFLGPPLVRLGIRKWTFARRLYGRLTRIKQKKPVKVEEYKIFLDENDSLGILNKKNFYENNKQAEIMKKFVKKGDVVMDIGANIGIYSLLLAKIVGNKGKVYSFEPDPKNFKILKKNIGINKYKNIIPIKKAISNKTGKTKLFIAEFNKGDHRIYPSDEKRKFIEIETISLNDYSKNNKDKIKFIKMDIQGAEVLAFEGGNSFFKKQKPVILQEFWPVGIKSSGKDYKKFLKFIYSNYDIYSEREIKEKLNPKKVLELVSLKKRNHINLLCIPKK